MSSRRGVLLRIGCAFLAIGVIARMGFAQESSIHPCRECTVDLAAQTLALDQDKNASALIGAREESHLKSPFWRVLALDQKTQSVQVLPVNPCCLNGAKSSADPFWAKVGPGDFANLSVGSEILAQRVCSEGAWRLEKIWPKEVMQAIENYGCVSSSPLKKGQICPPFALCDHFGNLVTQQDLTRQPSVVTFFFTRCPRANRCPKTLQKIRSLAAALKDSVLENYRLYCVSLDGGYDTPGILRHHLDSFFKDNEPVYGLTGPENQLESFYHTCGVHLRSDPGSVDIRHTLSTLVFDQKGCLQAHFFDHNYSPAQVVQDLCRLSSYE